MARSPLCRAIAERQADHLAELRLIGHTSLDLSNPFTRRLVVTTLEWAAEVELEKRRVRT